MSDDQGEVGWFPRELRDHLSAGAAAFGFFVGWFAPILVYPQLLNGLPGRPLSPTFVTLVVCLTAAFQTVVWCASTPYRMLGLAPPAAVALFAGYGWVHLTGRLDDLAVGLYWVGALNGLGVTFGYLWPRLLDPRPDRPKTEPAHLGNVLTAYKWVFGGLLAFHLLSLLVVAAVRGGGDGWTRAAGWYLFLLMAFLCAWCWGRLFRPFFELCCEPFFRPLYKIRARGPGVKAVPPLGPVLVIANHAAWFDPVFLGEFIPRPITPLMTESFYNIWFIRPILKYVFRVIVVRETAARREAPELREAIAALGRGECVVLFPEGFLRRKEEMVLRRFAQGIWHILTARPDTPVVTCWIEGGWESTFSWRGGPPWKGKRLDFRRPIDVGVNAPEVVPADVLADPLRTRLHLMNRVSAARAHIGLDPLPPFTRPAGEAESAQTEQPA